LSLYLSVYVGERERQTHTHTHTHKSWDWGGTSVFSAEFDGQFGVGGILELSFEEPRWGLTVSGEEIN
jgi:hypothetical protein